VLVRERERERARESERERERERKRKKDREVANLANHVVFFAFGAEPVILGNDLRGV